MSDGDHACRYCASAFAELWELNVHISNAHPGEPGILGRPPTVSVTLWLSDAVVLFNWLMKVDLDAVPVEHRAEKQALTDLLARLEETEVPYGDAGTGLTQKEIDRARDEVARDMDW